MSMLNNGKMYKLPKLTIAGSLQAASFIHLDFECIYYLSLLWSNSGMHSYGSKAAAVTSVCKI